MSHRLQSRHRGGPKTTRTRGACPAPNAQGPPDSTRFMQWNEVDSVGYRASIRAERVRRTATVRCNPPRNVPLTRTGQPFVRLLPVINERDVCTSR